MNDSRQRKMIFHVPFPLNPAATSASGIRPVKMRQAFEDIGFEVLEVSGTHSHRRDRIAALKQRVREGLKVDFVYSEASTTPTGLGEKITPATSLTRDIKFLRFCRTAGIPVGLFYRDIYWQFDEYAQRVGQPYTSLLRWRYRADLRGYVSAVDRIYLPSMRMADYLPAANQPQALPLPPGAERSDSATPDDGISLLYVGGTGGYYRMQETVRGVEMTPNARLTICTRETEWAEASSLYSDVLGESTTVVHRSGAELEPLYDDSHIGVLLMEPLQYREFAAPMKLYEYLGHGKPIIATEGTLVAQFVEEHKVGWVLPYRADALAELLGRLATHPLELEECKQRVLEAREFHTWQARALQVVTDLADT